MTSTLQLFPGFNVFMHCFLTANGAEVVSPVTITSIPECFESVFLIVTSFLLVLPILVLSPKLTGSGLNDSVPKGVAVEVGVAVGGGGRGCRRRLGRGCRRRRSAARSQSLLRLPLQSWLLSRSPSAVPPVEVAVAVAVLVGRHSVAVAVAVGVPAVAVAVAVAVLVAVGDGRYPSRRRRGRRRCYPNRRRHRRSRTVVGVGVAPVAVAVGVGFMNGVGHVLPAGLISVRNAAVLCPNRWY